MNRVALLLVFVFTVHSVCAQMTVQITGTITAGQGLSGGSSTFPYPVTGPGFAGAPWGSLSATLGTTTSLSLSASKYSFATSASAVADVRLLYAANAQLAGVLRITGTVAPGLGTASLSVDVDGDGQAELTMGSVSASTAVDVPVVLGPRAIAIDVDLSGSTNANGPTGASLNVQFLPQANLTTAGVVCGAGLTATLRKPTATTAGRLWLHAEDPPYPASVVGAFLIGSTPLTMGSTCGQGLVYDALVLVNPASGGVDLPAALSPALLGTVELQYVGLQWSGQLRWSNRIEMTLP